MTITVTANPIFTPPRNVITVSVTSGDVMSNPAVYRIVNGVSTLLRSQPAAGFDTQTVYDYEMPYDTPCTYEFVTDHFNPAGTTFWDETWANLSAWSGVNGTHSVSGGKLVFNPGGIIGAQSINRSANGVFRVTIASLAQTGAVSGGYSPSSVWLNPYVELTVASDGKLSVYDKKAHRRTKTTITASSPITVDMLNTSIFIKGLGGTWASSQFPVTGIFEVYIDLEAPNGTETFTVGEIKLTNYPVPTHQDESSSAVAISPTQAWLIHPSNPGLSVPVSSTDRSSATIRDISEVTNASTITEHQILGQSLPITTTSGPRLGSKFQMTVGVRTAAQESALLGLVWDGTPLMFRAPAIFPVGIDEGFYAVGDVTRARLSQRPGDPMRNFVLPMTKVQSPVVTVQNTGWSWAQLAAEFTTWAQVAAAFDTWADVFTNNRNPGY